MNHWSRSGISVLYEWLKGKMRLTCICLGKMQNVDSRRSEWWDGFIELHTRDALSDVTVTYVCVQLWNIARELVAFLEKRYCVHELNGFVPCRRCIRAAKQRKQVFDHCSTPFMIKSICKTLHIRFCELEQFSWNFFNEIEKVGHMPVHHLSNNKRNLSIRALPHR